jgi:hypothetical protein
VSAASAGLLDLEANHLLPARPLPVPPAASWHLGSRFQFSLPLLPELSLRPAQINPEEQAIQDYEQARRNFRKDLDNYWVDAESKKKNGVRVDDFPPPFIGPPKPPGYEIPPIQKDLPSVDTMLKLAVGLKRVAEQDPRQEDFKPRANLDEAAFKSNYVREALEIGKKHGLGLEQMREIVEYVYRFECGGRTGYDTLSGVPFKYSQPDDTTSGAPGKSNTELRRSYTPKSTGIGYTQILMSTTLRHLDQGGAEIAARLRAIGQGTDRQKELEDKAHLVESLQKLIHSETTALARHNKGNGKDYYGKDGQPLYYLYQDFAKSKERLPEGLTGRQLASAVQALLVDGDVGPVIQARQLGEVISQSLDPVNNNNLRQKLERDKSRADAYDKLPEAAKQKAVDDLIARAGAKKSDAANSVKDKLGSLPAGTSDLLSRENLSVSEYNYLNDRVLDLRHPTAKKGISPSSLLLDKVRYVYTGAPTADQYRPAFMELINLSGISSASAMVRPENLDASTVNFFERQGYHGNSITNRRTAGELVDAIYAKMQRVYLKAGTPDTSATGKYVVLEPGVAQFEQVFDQIKNRGDQGWK